MFCIRFRMDECSRVVLVGVEWPLLLFWASAGSGVGVEWLLLLLVQSRLLLSSSMVLLLLPVLLLLWLVEVLALVVLILILVLIIIVRNFSVGVAGGDVVGGTSSAVHHAVERDVSWVSCMACRRWLASFTLLMGAPI